MSAPRFASRHHKHATLTHEDARAIAEWALRQDASLCVIDLGASSQTDTAALAVLIRLRGELRAQGRDVALTGLRGRTRALFDLYALRGVIPVIDSVGDAPDAMFRPRRRVASRAGRPLSREDYFDHAILLCVAAATALLLVLGGWV